MCCHISKSLKDLNNLEHSNKFHESKKSIFYEKQSKGKMNVQNSFFSVTIIRSTNSFNVKYVYFSHWFTQKRYIILSSFSSRTSCNCIIATRTQNSSVQHVFHISDQIIVIGTHQIISVIRGVYEFGRDNHLHGRLIWKWLAQKAIGFFNTRNSVSDEAFIASARPNW